MATKREKAYLHNRTAQGIGLVGAFICMSVTWVWIMGQGTTWVDWFGFIAATMLFFYIWSMTIKGWRIRRARRNDREPPRGKYGA